MSQKLSLDRKRPLLKRTASVLGWGLFAVLMIAIWPAKLGGAMSYVIVKGHSMEPTLEPGDFAVMRTGSYDVGDVVSYHPFDDVPAQVIHRIIGFNEDGTVILQGDNNGFIDPFYPELTDVTGKMIFSVPNLGSFAWVLTSPLVWGSLILMAVALYLWPGRKKPKSASASVAEHSESQSAESLQS